MHKIVLATNNKNKLREVREILSPLGITVLSQQEAGTSVNPEENGTTFAENAIIKARAAAMSGYIGVGDDSGLEVNALGGAPGIYSARYAGEHGNDEANNQLLLQNLAHKQDRSGAFVCAIACVFPHDTDHAHVFLGKTEGEILHAYRGETGFGYDPLFYYPPMDKSYAEMTADEKNSISHRGRAMAQLVEFLTQYKFGD